MIPQTLIQDATRDGLTLAPTETGTLRVHGPKAVIARWAPTLKAHKTDLLAELTKTQPVMVMEPTDAEREAIEYAERVAAIRSRGDVPVSYTSTTFCEGCGPVHIFQGAPPHVTACPWCSNRVRGLRIPRPSVSCCDCQHFTPDPIGDGGIGSCAKNGPPQGQMPAYPHGKRQCSDFESKEPLQ